MPFRPHRPAATAGHSIGRAARGAAVVVRSWPGLVATVVGYAVVAVAVAAIAGPQMAYPQLVAIVVATAIGVGWYASPLRRWEANRRTRTRQDP